MSHKYMGQSQARQLNFSCILIGRELIYSWHHDFKFIGHALHMRSPGDTCRSGARQLHVRVQVDALILHGGKERGQTDRETIACCVPQSIEMKVWMHAIGSMQERRAYTESFAGKQIAKLLREGFKIHTSCDQYIVRDNKLYASAKEKSPCKNTREIFLIIGWLLEEPFCFVLVFFHYFRRERPRGFKASSLCLRMFAQKSGVGGVVLDGGS